MVAAAQTLFATTLREASLASVLLDSLEMGSHVLVKHIRSMCCIMLIFEQTSLIQNHSYFENEGFCHRKSIKPNHDHQNTCEPTVFHHANRL